MSTFAPPIHFGGAFFLPGFFLPGFFPYLSDMEEFKVHILGCGSANPLGRHLPASQVLGMRGKLFMVDCGEGTQTRLARQGLHMNRLGHIFISHVHGDHCFGLPGLVSTMGLLGRSAQLHIHGPRELQPFLDATLSVFCQQLTFPVLFHAVDTTVHALVYEDRSLQVYSLPLNHRVPTCGYLFREREGQRHINRSVTDAYDIPLFALNSIKAGADWTLPDGTLVPNERLTTPPSPTRSWAYVSDTRVKDDLAPLLQGVDLLYHEATFLQADLFRAKQTYHSTASEAGRIARMAHARRLCIGHFSARINTPQLEHLLLSEAQAEFPHTLLADEGLTLSL